jgi:EAL domain-containing protein (putative c-di-GMP-specific phosphodiesterase class I)
MAPSTTLLQVPESTLPRDLPDLGLQLTEIEALLASKGELGVLSITVLQREGGNFEEAWDDYEAVLREISHFLTRYAERKMRHSDVLLDPIIAGNTFLIFFDRPRDDRPLDSADLVRIRHRLKRTIDAHLARALSHAAVERFGVYVGGALLSHDDQIDCKRLVYRSLEEAFADALRQKRAETRRCAVYLKRILTSGSLRTVFQPLIDLRNRKVLGYEALTRVAPHQFQTPDLLFKAAHENGNLWSLEQLSRRRALESVPPMDPGMLLFMNIEPDSIHDPDLFSDRFLEQVKQAGLSPDRIVLEMTEHVAVKDFGVLREMLTRLKKVGFRLAMDDVGSGYSGLQAISEVNPDYLKIDMGLVRDLHINPIKRELIATIRRFTDTTGSVMIAEGVERPEELQELVSIGVPCAQGYLFGKPSAELGEPDWNHLEWIFEVETE